MVILKIPLDKKIFKISKKENICDILLNNKLLNTNIKYNLNNSVLEMYSILYYMYYLFIKSHKSCWNCVYVPWIWLLFFLNFIEEPTKRRFKNMNVILGRKHSQDTICRISYFPIYQIVREKDSTFASSRLVELICIFGTQWVSHLSQIVKKITCWIYSPIKNKLIPLHYSAFSSNFHWNTFLLFVSWIRGTTFINILVEVLA